MNNLYKNLPKHSSKKRLFLVFISGLISGIVLSILGLFYLAYSYPEEIKDTRTISRGKVILELYPEHAKLLKDSDAWLAQLNDAYLALKDLVGYVPYDGNAIVIKEFPENELNGAELLAGNPIKWLDKSVSEKLKAVNEFDDFNYGLIHELGHNFDIPNYNYLEGSGDIINAEQWANLKLIYVADVLSKKYPHLNFYQDKVGYVPIGEFPRKYFFDIFTREWLTSKDKNWKEMYHDVYTGLLYSLTEKYGWEPFKKTFREYNTYNTTSNPIPTDDLGKIQLFADLLSKHAGSGNDIKEQFRSWGIPIK